MPRGDSIGGDGEYLRVSIVDSRKREHLFKFFIFFSGLEFFSP
jgi:hypothetical protein